MSIAEFAAVIARRKWVVVIGVVAGIVVAFLMLYRVDRGPAGISLEPRSRTVYETQSIALIDIPGHAIAAADASLVKPVQVAPTYAYMAKSDAVTARVVQATGPMRATVKVEAPDNQPFLRITVQGDDAGYIKRVAAVIPKSLGEYLTSVQDDSSIPYDQRIVVSAIGTPTDAQALQSRGWEMGAIGFLAPVIAAIGVALVIERVELAHAVTQADAETQTGVVGESE